MSWFVVVCVELRLASRQVSHTAGVIAAWFGRIDALEYLMQRYAVDLTAMKPCFVCLECDALAALLPLRTTVSDRQACETREHNPSKRQCVAHGAAAGGQVAVLQYLKNKGAAMSTPDDVSLSTPTPCAGSANVSFPWMIAGWSVSCDVRRRARSLGRVEVVSVRWRREALRC